MRRFRGLKQLVHDAVDITTDMVEDANESVAAKVMAVLEKIEPIAEPARVVNEVRRFSARVVYESIHGVNDIVSGLGDLGLDAIPTDPASIPTIVPMRSDCTNQPPWLEDAAIGALNGVVGDYLHEKGNALDLGMHFRLGDRYVAPQDIEAPRIALFVHGVSTTEWGWCMNAEAYHGDAAVNFGTLLERDRGYTPVFLRYNSGRHISHNGRQLADLLDALPCEELVLIGHSMGGLVARSACYYGEKEHRRWPGVLTHVFCLGSPHLGAPLEKAGNVITSVLGLVDVPGTQIPARIINARSAGIKDLRFGYLIDEDWEGRAADALLENNRQDLPLLDGVTYAFIAATLTENPDHPVGQLLGDLIVRTKSASGPTTVEESFDVHTDRVSGMLHHEIQNHPDVYERMLGVFSTKP
ncbi:MAG: alpha/beta fold hydrolase [Deltaproteobacteria bacterium]|nr:alpha/beta fold hydrolase [Deltaproteobacteria bacterium]